MKHKFDIGDEDILNREFKTEARGGDTLSNMGSFKSKKTQKIKSRSMFRKKKKEKSSDLLESSPMRPLRNVEAMEMYTPQVWNSRGEKVKVAQHSHIKPISRQLFESQNIESQFELEAKALDPMKTFVPKSNNENIDDIQIEDLNGGTDLPFQIYNDYDHEIDLVRDDDNTSKSTDEMYKNMNQMIENRQTVEEEQDGYNKTPAQQSEDNQTDFQMNETFRADAEPGYQVQQIENQ